LPLVQIPTSTGTDCGTVSSDAAGSNPATPTSFLVAPIAYAASYAERNGDNLAPPFHFSSLGRSRERWLSLPAFGGAARAPLRRLLPPAQMGQLLRVGSWLIP
jgi:hypothetical protein